MKGSIFLPLAALAAQAVSAVPHRESDPASRRTRRLTRSGRDHKHLHQRQVDPSGTVVTVTKTIVEPSAVVWVDDAGHTISTEYRGPPATAAPNANSKSPPAVVAGAGDAVAAVIPSVPSSAATPSSTPAVNGTGGYGICYDMINAQTQCKSSDQVGQDFAFLAQNGYKMVRTYDVGCDVGVIVQQAAAHGMTVMAGINSVSNVAGDLQKLINYVNGNWANVVTVNIGNEQINQGAASVAQVTAAVDTGRAMLKAAGYNGNVVTVDVFNQFIANPTLASNSDFVAANVSIPWLQTILWK